MAYIGNTVQNQGFAPAIDYFNGNGVTVTFTLSRPVASVAQVIVAVDNVIQNPSSSFTVAGNAITFSSAPLSGTNNIWVEYTSLITTYQGISQDPTVIGDIRATGGYLAEGDFGNSFVDGAILDYVTGRGRVTVGDLDDITFYHGGTAGRSAMMDLYYAGGAKIYGTTALTIPVGTTAERPGTPTSGMIRQNTTTGNPEWYNTTSSSWVPFSSAAYAVSYLVVAGGGGGASGGGGAGGYLTSTTTVTPATVYTITVGAGGTAGSGGGTTEATNGTNSIFGSLVNGSTGAVGGGKGSTIGNNGIGAGNGGSGGGGGAFSGGTTSGGSGTAGQGNNGGGNGGNTGAPYSAGGGGGASAVGSNSPDANNGGAGGAGTASSITGSSVTYAGGGGGGVYGVGSSGGTGGAGGGGAGAVNNGTGTSGTANTGGGGGGGGNGGNGGVGGSGIVIISYAGAQRGTGGTVTSSGGNTIHTFTSSGTYTS